MKINFEKYKDSVKACWIGKNIGGTMGGPYEGKREMLDIQGFSTPENTVLPNDDLDLQIVWLAAVERIGAKNIKASTLGEFWLSYISPYWNEYGRGKTNMKMGILPALSGDAFNDWKDSNGGWIRTEIWACLLPAAPHIAARYAYEDASVDHGSGEGTIAAMFTAAVESAAFAEKDIIKLINIGLSIIPAESRTAKSVQYVIDCYKEGKDYKDVRDEILELNKDIGTGWFEAPSNIAYAVIGLLWGEGDFKKSMIYAINCGDDTDCTGGFVGAVMGIIGGTKIIPEDWSKHIGDEIVTVAIATGVFYGIPKTCTELTDRVVALAPSALFDNGINAQFIDGKDDIDKDKMLEKNKDLEIYYPYIPYSYRIDFNYASAIICYDGNPTIAPNETKRVTVRFINNIPVYGNGQYFLKFRFLCDDEFSVKGPKTALISRWSVFDVDFNHDCPYTDVVFEITAKEKVLPQNRIVIEAVADGRVTVGYIPLIFLGE